jgi:hypothetical protein
MDVLEIPKEQRVILKSKIKHTVLLQKSKTKEGYPVKTEWCQALHHSRLMSRSVGTGY